MSTASKIPAFMDALVACLLGALTADQVIDGTITDSAATSYVHVGCSDPDDQSMQNAAESGQGWAWIGHTQRREDGTVHCVAVCLDGNGSQKTARDGAYALLKIVCDAIENDPSLGGAATWTVGVTSHSLRQIQDDDGATAQITFDVEFVAYP